MPSINQALNERHRVEVGAHSVAAGADQAEILHAKVEHTIQMGLFLPSAVTAQFAMRAKFSSICGVDRHMNVVPSLN